MNGRMAWIAATGLCAALGACGGGGSSDEPAQEPPYGLDQRVAVAPLGFPAQGLQSGALRTVRAFPALQFEAPLALAAVPGRDRLGLATQGGRVYQFEPRDDVQAATLVLDLSDRTRVSGEQGLLGLAYDPQYPSNGLVYVYYVDLRSRDPGTSVIARFRADPASGMVDRASEQRLLQFDQPYSNHNGGAIAFGPDGMLYIASGDGGSGNDPQNRAQDLGSVFGKILRLHADGAIPADNPFVSTAGARGEIWAYGLRNPFRMSFDEATGQLWAGDVGQDAVEEIDLVVRGGNYGWPVYEGTRSNKNPDARPASDFAAPLHTYGRDQGQSVTGGVVYRGPLTELAGRYVYGDFISGRLWALAETAGAVTSNLQIGSLSNPSAFGHDARGEVYVSSYAGGLYRFERSDEGGAAEFPQLLSQTGLFADTARLAPAAGLIEYAVNAPLWSDGAAKRRWIALPGTQRIGFAGRGAWTLPEGSVIVKHFEMRLADGSDRRLETRVLIREPDSGWQGYTYRWNDAGTDASLLDAAQTVQLSVPDGAGGSRSIGYEFPSRSDCLRCHTAAAGSVLGLRTEQMNRVFDYGAVSDNQLRSYDHIGLFDRSIGAADAYPALADPADTGAALSARARAYLDSNCAQCHRPGGPTPVNLDLRWDTAVAAMNTHDVAPAGDDLGIADARRIAPGDKQRSLVWERMRRLDAARMPPLASHTVDEAGVQLIGSWIDAGAP